MSETETTLEVLMRRAEAALESDSSGIDAERILEQMLELALPGTEPSAFAHHRLAEARMQRNPWQAALHLRKVLQVRPDDHSAHGLMGLCQSLLGNHRVAVASYRRAVRLDPGAPWYRHNLGHLMDVALDDAQGALRHLEAAQKLAPADADIASSYAHCLARLGKLERAAELAYTAVTIDPRNADHRRLLVWIEAGAPAEYEVTNKELERLNNELSMGRSIRDEVERAVVQALGDTSLTSTEVDSGVRLWREYYDRECPVVRKPEVFAAAIEYAMSLILGRPKTTQRDIAKRHGVSVTSLRSRYSEMRELLDLRPGDPRFA